MACSCLDPNRAWICGTVKAKDGIISPNLVFSISKAIEYHKTSVTMYGEDGLLPFQVEVPCGHCHLCALRKRKDMTCRIANEAFLSDNSCFITLTYNDDNLPFSLQKFVRGSSSVVRQKDMDLMAFGEPTLYPRDVQLFMKRLRRHLEYHKGLKGLRYFCVGEYGSKQLRPHYHIIIFGWSPDDLEVWKRKHDHFIFRSSLIESKWKYGFSTVAPVNTAVARYCARYCTKKFEHSNISDFVCPEFFLQSVRGGGIGIPWLKKFSSNLLQGFINVGSSDSSIVKFPIPKLYVRRLRDIDPSLYLKLRDFRIDFIKKSASVNFDDLLRHSKVSFYESKYLEQFEDF